MVFHFQNRQIVHVFVVQFVQQLFNRRCRGFGTVPFGADAHPLVSCKQKKSQYPQNSRANNSSSQQWQSTVVVNSSSLWQCVERLIVAVAVVVEITMGKGWLAMISYSFTRARSLHCVFCSCVNVPHVAPI